MPSPRAFKYYNNMIKQTFDLPQPPSANRYWRKTRAGRIYIGEDGIAYRRLVGKLLMINGYKPLEDARIGMDLIYFPPLRGGLDLDNISKALWDALEMARLFNNDKQIDDYRQRRAGRFERGLVRVTVWPDPEPCHARP